MNENLKSGFFGKKNLKIDDVGQRNANDVSAVMRLMFLLVAGSR